MDQRIKLLITKIISEAVPTLATYAINHYMYQEKMKTLRNFLESMKAPPTMEVNIKELMKKVNEPRLSKEEVIKEGESEDIDKEVEMESAFSSYSDSCEVCSIKHLLSSKTFLIEGLSREGVEKQSKILEAYRELQASEQHLVEKHPDLAKEVRKLRKKIEPCALLGEKCEDISIAEIDMMIRKIIPYVPREQYFQKIEEAG